MSNLTPHPSWEIIDSTKIDDFLRCPRRYFYRYILGWRLDVPTHDAYFGECWHRAREHQLIHGYDDIEGAFEAFLRHYRKEFPPETDKIHSPKNPEAVKLALANFAVTYHDDLEKNELLKNPETGEPFTEISGSVPIDEERSIYFRMDSLLRNKETGKIFSWDHKTTGKYITSDMWERQFYLSIQSGTYTHCMYCLFPIEEVLGVEFCGVGFEYLSRGSSVRPAGYYSTLRRVPAFKTPDQMNVWLWTVTNAVYSIEENMDRLSHCKESDKVLMAFPINPQGCSKFKGCEFHDFCIRWPNPLIHAPEPPFGFRQEFWDPREKDARNKMQLEWR